MGPIIVFPARIVFAEIERANHHIIGDHAPIHRIIDPAGAFAAGAFLGGYHGFGFVSGGLSCAGRCSRRCWRGPRGLSGGSSTTGIHWRDCGRSRIFRRLAEARGNQQTAGQHSHENQGKSASSHRKSSFPFWEWSIFLKKGFTCHRIPGPTPS